MTQISGLAGFGYVLSEAGALGTQWEVGNQSLIFGAPVAFDGLPSPRRLRKKHPGHDCFSYICALLTQKDFEWQAYPHEVSLSPELSLGIPHLSPLRCFRKVTFTSSLFFTAMWEWLGVTRLALSLPDVHPPAQLFLPWHGHLPDFQTAALVI